MTLTLNRLMAALVAVFALSFVAACNQTTKPPEEGADASETDQPTTEITTEAEGTGGEPTTETASGTEAKSNVAFTTNDKVTQNADGSYTYNWGSVSQGEKVDYEFQFKNTGTETLEISKIDTSCGCTTSEYTKVVEPNGVGTVMAHVATDNLSGRPTRSLTVHTNSSETPEIKINLTGEVKTHLKLNPGAVNFGSIQVDRGNFVGTFERMIRVEKGDALEGELSLTSVQVPANMQPWLSVREERQPDGSYNLYFDMNKEAAFEAAKGMSTQQQDGQNQNNHMLRGNITVQVDGVPTPKTVSVNANFQELS